MMKRCGFRAALDVIQLPTLSPSLMLPPDLACIRSAARTYFAMALLLVGAVACVASPPPPSPPPKAPEPALATPPAAPRIVQLEDGSYVELSAGVEPGFAHCCGDEHYQIEIECSDGLLRCYEKSGKRWKQTYGKHCKASLDQQCYEQTCVRVCEAYWELGPTLWQEVIPD